MRIFKSKFYPPDSDDALEFTFDMQLVVHAYCAVIEIANKSVEITEGEQMGDEDTHKSWFHKYAMLRKFFMATKVMCMFYWVAFIQLQILGVRGQSGYLFSRDIHKTMLKYDVFFFYYSIASLILCLFISRFVPY